MTPEMTPDDFQALLDRELDSVSQRTGEPLSIAVRRDVAAGRRLLRRRRASQAVLGVGAACLVLAVAAGVLTGNDDDARTTHPAGALGMDEVLRHCLQGNQSDTATHAIDGDGSARVRVAVRNELWTMAAVQSADDSHWAECFISHDPANEFAAGMTVHRSAGRAKGLSFGAGTGCAKTASAEVDRSCRLFSVRWVDRLPPAVAEVRFTTGDSKVTRVETVDGFVVLNYLGTLPQDARIDRYGGTGPWEPLLQVTYLDSSGSPIAAQDFADSGRGVDGERVSGLPTLNKFPSVGSRTM